MAVVGLVFGLLATAGFVFLMPKQYESTAVIELRFGAARAIGESRIQATATQFEKIKARKTLSEVAENLDLASRWGLDQELVHQRLRDSDLAAVAEKLREPDELWAAAGLPPESIGNESIHDEAGLPTTAVSPNVPLVLVMGSVSGLLLSPIMAFAFILLLNRLLPEKPPIAGRVGRRGYELSSADI